LLKGRFLPARQEPRLFLHGSGSALTATCFFFTALMLGSSPAYAQATPPPPKYGPGTPLPQIRLDFLPGQLSYDRDEKGRERATVKSGTLTYGDLQIKADTITLLKNGDIVEVIEAAGHISITRGDESLRGERFTFWGTEGAADSERVVIISPPFYLSADRFIRGKNGTVIQNARIVPSPDGKGELSISAREIQVLSDSKRAILRDMTIRLFGTRLLTVRHARIPLGDRDRETDRDKGGLSLPLTFRVSGISGTTVGLRLPLVVDNRTSGEYGVEFPQRNSPQYYARLRRDLIKSDSIGRERSESALFALPGGMGNQTYEGLSPIRQLAMARPLPPTPDPILDYDSILLSSDPVERPVRALNRNLYVEVNTSTNRDISNKRQGPLLLSRIPEVQVSGSLPLVGKVPHGASNATLRRFLQSPHLQLTGSGIIGRYSERRLQNDQQTISSNRVGMSLGIGTLPLLIGDHLLLRPQMNANYFHYNTRGASTYRIIESSVTLDYIFYDRTMIGGSYIRRDQNGVTPFTFDQVDTRDEGQVRAQIALPGGKFTLASQIRYDIKQSRIFDREIAIAWRGKTIEPRLSYRTQNSQFGFGLALPGFLP
jgi:hypothetical protein